MSKPPFMIDCYSCQITDFGRLKRPLGTVIRVLQTFNNGKIKIADICEKCGGRGRISATLRETKDGTYVSNMRFVKRHKVEMQKWLELEKELIYGKIERI